MVKLKPPNQMINIRELRIGNIVQPTNDIQTEAPGPVDTEWWSIIHEQQRDLKPGEEMEWEIDVEPVPITPEWLNKLGFIKHDESLWYHGIVCVQIDETGVYSWIAKHEPWFPFSHLRYKNVHQLQNLVFLLTGEELKVK